MRLSTREVPQADVLADVVRAVEAVGRGIRRFQDIARHIGKVERQGRYYRLAAQLLGLIQNERNHAVLTQLGRQLLAADSRQRKSIIAGAVLSTRMVQRIIPFLEHAGTKGVPRREIEAFITNVTERTEQSMIHRRASTVASWLGEIGVIVERGGRYFIRGLPKGVELIDYAADDEPLFPKKYQLDEYEELAKKTQQRSGSLTVLINKAKQDRARTEHQFLTKLLASKLRKMGAIPRRNRLIDLAARIGDKVYLFEVKSTTPSNAHEQVRDGIAQLYEYRYVQAIEDARLVLVLEQPLPRQLEWLTEYLLRDRNILLAWDGDRRTFSCPAEVRSELRFVL